MGRSKESWISIWNTKADQDQRHDVEKANSPEHLFHRRGQRFPRVGSLGCGKADKLCACKGKCCGDKYGTDTFESVVESSRVVPVLAPYI
jgi:hypothetical protein